MSLMFKPPRKFDPKLVQVMLNENALLIEIVTEYQNKGKIQECMKYHDILTRNLLYLSGISNFQADESFNPLEIKVKIEDQLSTLKSLKKDDS